MADCGPSIAGWAAATAGQPAEPRDDPPSRPATHDAVREVGSTILDALARQDAARATEQAGSQTSADVALYVEQLPDDLDLGGHEEAERRVNRLVHASFPRSAAGRARGNHPRGHNDQG